MCACECAHNLLLITCTGRFKGKVSAFSFLGPSYKKNAPLFPQFSGTCFTDIKVPLNAPSLMSNWWYHRSSDPVSVSRSLTRDSGSELCRLHPFLDLNSLPRQPETEMSPSCSYTGSQFRLFFHSSGQHPPRRHREQQNSFLHFYSFLSFLFFSSLKFRFSRSWQQLLMAKHQIVSRCSQDPTLGSSRTSQSKSPIEPKHSAQCVR